MTSEVSNGSTCMYPEYLQEEVKKTRHPSLFTVLVYTLVWCVYQHFLHCTVLGPLWSLLHLFLSHLDTYCNVPPCISFFPILTSFITSRSLSLLFSSFSFSCFYNNVFVFNSLVIKCYFPAKVSNMVLFQEQLSCPLLHKTGQPSLNPLLNWLTFF